MLVSVPLRGIGDETSVCTGRDLRVIDEFPSPCGE